MLNPSKLLDYRVVGVIGLVLSLACGAKDKGTGDTGDTGGRDASGNGGNGGNGGSDDPAIEVTPSRLDFTEGGGAVQTFTVSSIGDVDLDVSAITLDQGTDFTLTTPGGGTPYTMAPGGSINVTVTWEGGNNAAADTVTVASSDPANPSATVGLYGPNAGGILTLSPDHWDAGSVAVGDSTSGSIDLVANDGPVVVSSLVVSGDGFDGEWGPSLPVTLDAGERLEVALNFVPPGEGSYTGRLVAGTASGNVTAQLTGEGIAAGGPVAVCSVDPAKVTLPSDVATFSGAESYDSGGRSISSYAWTLTSHPAGSTAALPGGSASDRRFTADVEGTYVASLVVTNDRGDRSDACEATLEAVSAGVGSLVINLTWSAADDDMDLHLLRPGGAMNDATDDCYYANTDPEWGSARLTTDNPSLVLDDIDGTGPEEIDLDVMGDVGAYEVWVDDYTGSTGDSPRSNNVTVEIYEGGRLVYTDTKACAAECADMHFADIDSATGRVTSR